MNAQKKQDLQKYNDPSLKKALVVSTIFHVGLFLLTILGLPMIHKPPVILAPVSVELVDIAEITRTTRIAPPSDKELEKPKEIEAPKPPEEKRKPPPRSEPESKPEIPEPAIPEPVKPEEKKPEPVKETEPKKEEKKKPKPKPKLPEPEKEDPKKQEEDFTSLLKNLAPEEPQPQNQETPEEKIQDKTEPASGALAQLGDQMTISELDALRHQLAPCWNIPAGAEFAENLAVEVQVIMNRDGTVQNASVLDQGRYNYDSAFRSAADSAIRALRNPLCSPLRLPPEKYESWKNIIINFDPRQML